MQPMHRRMSTTMANRLLCVLPAACDETLVVSLIDLSPEDDVVLALSTLPSLNIATSVPVVDTGLTNKSSLGTSACRNCQGQSTCYQNVTPYGFSLRENVTKSLSTMRP